MSIIKGSATIARHNKPLPDRIIAPDSRFKHIHVDIVGPLPISNGYQYMLTIIDRYSRWPEAIPIEDITARTVAYAILDTWIARHGAPEIITTDQGRQFEAKLFNELLQFTGCDRIRTTAFHPAANGMVERWHRDLKAALMSQGDNPEWTRVLPMVLLGLRTRVRLDTGVSPAEYVFGTTLRIPGAFYFDDDIEHDDGVFLRELKEYMQQAQPVKTEHKHARKPFVYKEMRNCTHVFVQRNPNRPPLHRPYSGPHKVLARALDGKTITIDVDGKRKTVTIERVKPAHILTSETEPDQANDETTTPRDESPPEVTGRHSPVPDLDEGLTDDDTDSQVSEVDSEREQSEGGGGENSDDETRATPPAYPEEDLRDLFRNENEHNDRPGDEGEPSIRQQPPPNRDRPQRRRRFWPNILRKQSGQ